MSGDTSWNLSSVSMLFPILKSLKSWKGTSSIFIFSITDADGFCDLISEVNLSTIFLLYVFIFSVTPSVVLVTIPLRLYFWASLYINGLKPTPWTMPDIFILKVFKWLFLIFTIFKNQKLIVDILTAMLK